MTPSDAQLQGSLEHLHYEVDQLCQAAKLLIEKYDPENPRSEDDRIIGNALVESFAVHARNLKEFFFHGDKDDGVRAGHYLNGQQEWRETHPMPPIVRQIDQIANKKVSHLTYARVTDKIAEMRWDLGAISCAFQKALDEFSQQLKEKGQVTSNFVFPANSQAIVQPQQIKVTATTSCSTVGPGSQSSVGANIHAKTAPPDNPKNDGVRK